MQGELIMNIEVDKIINNIINGPDIEPDSHDGSYELVRETVESLSKVDKDILDINDLNLLYAMAIGNRHLSVSVKSERIYKTNLSSFEKDRLNKVLEKVDNKAKNGEYSNRFYGQNTIGMFGTGFMVFRRDKTTKEDARKFINSCVNIKDMKNEEEILELVETTFKYGLGGIQSASASIMLHCLKPTVFPVINGGVIDEIVILEDEGVVLNRPDQLNTYIANVRKIKKFRDDKCKFKNYRVLDIELWKLSKLKESNRERKKEESKKLDIEEKTKVGKKRLEAIVDAFKKIGGEGKIEDIFDVVKDDPRFKFHKFSNDSSAKGSIRLIIQEHSSDTKIYKDINEDLFYSVEGIGKGIWGLRKSNIGLTPVDFSKSLEFGSLYFEDVDILKKQISTALKSGKSIILVGAPGTGKSKLAKCIANSYDVEYKMVTAMSDWSSYDTIGGYKPSEDGSLYFEEGIFLSSLKNRHGKNKNQWLIIDEINRADIDKAFGPFFSALSGDDVELGLKDKKGRNIELLLEKYLDKDITIEKNQYIIPKDWRIIGTMNTFDKTSLYDMSYAFMRRFAFIPVSIPRNIDSNMIEELFSLWDVKVEYEDFEYMAILWKIINKYRKIGPAIVEDIGRFIELGGDYTSGIIMYILPQLEGLFDDKIYSFVKDLKKLEFINDIDRLEESVEDFFDIKLLGE